MKLTSGYLDTVMRPEGLKKTVGRMVELIESKKLTFNAVAISGMSGALVGPSIALLMEKMPVIVRKPGDGSHSSRHVEGEGDIQGYIIVDDFRSTGATLRRILDGMTNNGASPDDCKGIFLYTGCSDTFIYEHGGKEHDIPVWA